MRDYYIAIFLGGFREIVAEKLASFNNNFTNLKKKKNDLRKKKVNFKKDKCFFLFR